MLPLALAVALLVCGGIPATADARPLLRASSTAKTAGAATTLTVPMPGGLVLGDVVLLFVDAEGSGAFGAAPTGWTAFDHGATSTGYSGTWWHVVAAGDPASVTFDLGSSRRAMASVLAYAGVDTVAPIGPTAQAGADSAEATATAASVTTTVADSLIVLGLKANAAGTVTFSPPGTVTPRTSDQMAYSTTTQSSYTAEFLQATAGATGTRAFGMSPSAKWAAHTITLRPATSGLTFDDPPNVPPLPSVALNGQARTVTAQMPAFTVSDTGGTSGWNVTVAGDGSGGRSAVFKAYCPNATCGTHSGPGYVAGGTSLPANSLRLSSAGASFSGLLGAAPKLQCGAGCDVDSATPVKVVSASPGEGQGPWTASGFGASSLTLSVPTTVRVLEPGEVYRADLLWTLSSGP